MAYDNNGDSDDINVFGIGCVVVAMFVVWIPVIVFAVAISYRVSRSIWLAIVG